MRGYCWILFLVLFCLHTHAYETDQYTTPKVALADMGEDLSRFIYSHVQLSIQEINQDVTTLPTKLAALESERDQLIQSAPGASAYNLPEEIKSAYEYLDRQIRNVKERLQLLQSEQGLVKAIHQKFSSQITWQEQRDGVFGAPPVYWNYPDNLKEGKIISFRAGKLDIVYSFAGFHRLISPTYFVFASTIKAYGIHFGVDKIGHIFNQGFQYYEIFEKSLAAGMDQNQAAKKAMDWGIETEDGIFGKIVDGVYSNADLAANYSGFLFFQNLFKEVIVGSNIMPAKLIRKADGTIAWNPTIKIDVNNFVKSFITQHLDESLNPSLLESPQRRIVRNAIKSRCKSWKEFYQLHDRQQVESITTQLKTFYGSDYGHKDENTLKIEEICWP